MKLLLVASFSVLLFGAVNSPNDVPDQEEITLDSDNIKITKSVKVKPGKYEVQDKDNNGVLHITGSDITIDFQGATLWGCDSKTAGEARKGTGISVKGNKVTLRNANVHGFFFNIKAEGGKEVTIEKCNASFSRAERLLKDGKYVGIFLHLRHVGAWRGYGAGIWLEKCSNSVVRNCVTQEAQNGIILVDSDRCQLLENDTMYQSGWGVGLWNSSDNIVMYNLIDFCNRDGGGDAAGLVVVNNSNRNWFVANSMTHGGDGFFLTNQKDLGNPDDGPCNDNVIAFNDGSYSPNNAFEATFSWRNCFVGNLSNHSNYGYWCGFSNVNLFVGNEIENNNTHGIAIEQGHGSVIDSNIFSNNKGSAIWLFAKKDRSKWPSKDYVVRNNAFSRNKFALDLTLTENVDAKKNFWKDAKGGNVARLVQKNQSSVDTGDPLSDEPKIPKLLTFSGGFDAIKAGKEEAVLKELIPYLGKVGCKIDTKVILPKLSKEFKMYKDLGMPLGRKYLKDGEYCPVKPKSSGR